MNSRFDSSPAGTIRTPGKKGCVHLLPWGTSVLPPDHLHLTGPSEVVRVSQASTAFLCRAGSVEQMNSLSPGLYRSSGRSASLVIKVTSVSVGCVRHKAQASTASQFRAEGGWRNGKEHSVQPVSNSVILVEGQNPTSYAGHP